MVAAAFERCLPSPRDNIPSAPPKPNEPDIMVELFNQRAYFDNTTLHRRWKDY